MPKENNLVPIEAKKSFETIQEIEKYEIKKSPLSSAARSKIIKKYGSNYVSENKEGYGPMYHASSTSNNFSIRYFFSHGGGNEKLFFEKSGVYTTELNINGNLWKLRNELRKLENGEIRVFNLVRGHYERDRSEEETIKESLREDIRKCEEMVRDLEPNRGCGMEMERTFSRII